MTITLNIYDKLWSGLLKYYIKISTGIWLRFQQSNNDEILPSNSVMS